MYRCVRSRGAKSRADVFWLFRLSSAPTFPRVRRCLLYTRSTRKWFFVFPGRALTLLAIVDTQKLNEKG